MSFNQALAHFKKVDPILYRVALGIPPIDTSDSEEATDPSQYFAALCDTIVSQQLSVKAADTIWARIIGLFPGRKVTRCGVLEISEAKLRECGCSFSKIRYLKNLAAAEIDFIRFPGLSDREITRALVAVKGIGPWTAEMFLMFTMNRPDIFSYGDLGLKNAIKKLPGLQNPEIWSPYRSYASRILWKSLGIK